ncbi:MAG: hypothetical protein JWP48_3805 [Actinoallomurus sp.]|jgi:hypothetical protein|nr:hypothetical protein [Actinoallomurus sp.]
MTAAINRFLRFWWDFLIGDDWTVAVGVVLTLTVTALLAAAGIPAWWLPPAAVVLLLGRSLRGETRRDR